MESMLNLFDQAVGLLAELVVFPELALSPFFAHWGVESEEELLSYYETQMPNRSVAPLLGASCREGIAVTFGYAEASDEGGLFNPASLFEGRRGVLRYRKAHLPGYGKTQSDMTFQNLGKSISKLETLVSRPRSLEISE